MQTRRLLFWLLALTLAKGIVTGIIVPLWEFPDEQAHFAQVSHYVEAGFNLSGDNLSREIYFSETVLGTLRDERGNNRYTYHPDYRPAYSVSTIGPQEAQINQIPLAWRSEMVKQEAAQYPALFYLLSALGYLAVYPSNLFIRVFATRLVSVLLTLIAVTVTFFLGRLLFTSHHKLTSRQVDLLSFTLAFSLSFHPMFSFVSSGINNDNALNLISAVAILLTLTIFHSGITPRRSLLLGLSLALGLFTKPLILPLIFPLTVILLWEWYRQRRSLSTQISLTWPLLLPALLCLVWFFILPWIKSGHPPYLPESNPISPQAGLSPLTYLFGQLGRYYRETLVWYWGVFKWLGIVLPLNLIRGIKIALVLSVLGLIKLFRSRRPLVAKSQVVNLLLISLLYLTALTVWDYFMVKNLGFSHGLQGRYFFPTLPAHLALFILGWLSLLPRRFLIPTSFIILLSFLLLHTASWFTLAHSYYDLWPLDAFTNQISQYKPFFLKFPFSLLWFLLYLAILFSFLTLWFKYARGKK